MAAQKAFLSDLCHRIDINAFPLHMKEKISSFRFPLLDKKSVAKETLHMGAVTVLKSFERKDITSTSVHFGQDLWLYMVTNLSIGRTKQIVTKCGDLNYKRSDSSEMNSLYCYLHRLCDFRFVSDDTNYGDERLLEVGKVMTDNIFPLFDELASLIKDENKKSGFLENVLNAKNSLEKVTAIPTAQVEYSIIPWRGKNEIFVRPVKAVSAHQEEIVKEKNNDEVESDPSSSSFDQSSKEKDDSESSGSSGSSEKSDNSSSGTSEESDPPGDNSTKDDEEADVEEESEDNSKKDATAEKIAKNVKSVPKEDLEQKPTPKKPKSGQKKKAKPKPVAQTPRTNRGRASSRRSSSQNQLETIINEKKRDAASSGLKRVPPSPNTKRLRPSSGGDN